MLDIRTCSIFWFIIGIRFYGRQVRRKGCSWLPYETSVEADTNYKPKYGAGSNVEQNDNGTISEKNRYAFLRYSYTDIKILPDTMIVNGKKISLEIKSYVSPAPSYLNTQYTSNPTKLALFNSIKGTAANNQVLAMLRSFGLLEGIVQKILFYLNNTYGSSYSSSEKTYITSRIKEIFPDYNDPNAVNILCKDENLTGATVLANDINRNNYEDLKIW